MRCPRCGADAPVGVVRVRRGVVVSVLAGTIVASWLVVAPILEQLLEGMERVSIDLRWLPLPLALAVAAAFSWILHVRRPVCATCGVAWPFVVVPPAASERLVALPARRRVLRHALGMIVGTTAAAASGFGAAMV